MPSVVAKNIERRMQALGLTRKSLSIKAGINATGIRDIVKGKSQHPRHDTLGKIAKALGCTVDDLRGDTPVDAGARPAPAPQAPRPGLAAGALPTQPMQTDDRERNNPLPVWASAEGGEEGAMLITSGPIDWIPRPRSLQVRGAFAVYLVGDSMSPAYEHGDQLYIHPHRPPRGTDDCLFVRELDDGTLLGLAKRLVRHTSDKWRVRQFNPFKDFDLDRRKWTKAWVIVGKMNRA
jgi:phage repressor protein C with HTH and peptisase S24 domain